MTVVAETGSTQDSARRLGARPGDVVVAGRQSAGRGRLGRRWADTGVTVPDGRILCIGDGVLTDIQGAQGEDLDSLFISGGLAAAETKTTHQPDPEALTAYLNAEMVAPTYAIGQLR